jgi:hypothetical protein
MTACQCCSLSEAVVKTHLMWYPNKDVKCVKMNEI